MVQLSVRDEFLSLLRQQISTVWKEEGGPHRVKAGVETTAVMATKGL